MKKLLVPILAVCGLALAAVVWWLSAMYGLWVYLLTVMLVLGVLVQKAVRTNKQFGKKQLRALAPYLLMVMVLTILDTLTTYFAVKRGIGVEANQWSAYLMQKLGGYSYYLLPVNTAVAVSLLTYLLVKGVGTENTKKLLTAVALLICFAVVNNAFGPFI